MTFGLGGAGPPDDKESKSIAALGGALVNSAPLPLLLDGTSSPRRSILAPPFEDAGGGESIEAALHGRIFTQAKSKDNERRKESSHEWKEGRLACVKSPRPDPNQMYPKDCRNRPKNCSDRAVECLRFAFDA